jgi:hypothetical protein
MKFSTAVQAAVIALCIIPVSSGALAISRYQSMSMPCAQIRAIILNEGAAIFRWTQAPNIDRFGRYVAHGGYCFLHEEVKIVRIPASDTPACAVLECQPTEDDFFFRRFKPSPH